MVATPSRSGYSRQRRYRERRELTRSETSAPRARRCLKDGPPGVAPPRERRSRSSGLGRRRRLQLLRGGEGELQARVFGVVPARIDVVAGENLADSDFLPEIGRASCRERV